jgi:hypothetical protein
MRGIIKHDGAAMSENSVAETVSIRRNLPYLAKRRIRMFRQKLIFLKLCNAVDQGFSNCCKRTTSGTPATVQCTRA